MGLKTGMYYLRRKPAKRAIQSAVDIDIEQELEEKSKMDKDKVGTPKVGTHEIETSIDKTTDEIVAPASPPTPLGSPQRNDDLNNDGFVCYREEGCLSCGS